MLETHSMCGTERCPEGSTTVVQAKFEVREASCIA